MTHSGRAARQLTFFDLAADQPLARGCLFPGCPRPHYALGWCHPHHTQRKRADGDESKMRKVREWRERGNCSYPNCSRPWVCNSWCKAHNTQWARRDRDESRMMPIYDACVICGTELPLRKRRYCSSACKATWRQYRGYDYGGWCPEALAAWLGPACGVCGKDVDMSLPRTDDEGPTTDHVDSRRDGGSDHWSNLQLCHKSCNSKKGPTSRYVSGPRGELKFLNRSPSLIRAKSRRRPRGQRRYA